MMPSRHPCHAGPALLLVLAAACGGGGAEPSKPSIGPAASVSITSTPAASGVVKTAVGNLVAKVIDVNGNAVPGVGITFSAIGGGGITFSPASASTDASGLATSAVTLGSKAGVAELRASAAGVLVEASATVRTNPGPIVSLVTSPKSMRFAAVGDTARIVAKLQDEYANAVTTALSYAITDPTVVTVDPQGLVRALRAGATATVTVSASGRSDTVGVRVRAPGESACVGVAAATPLAVGDLLTVQGGLACLPGASSANAEYTVIAYNSSLDGSSSIGATITPDGVATPPTSLRIPTSTPLFARGVSGLGGTSAPVEDDRFHRRVLAQGRSLRGLFAGARAAYAARRAASRTSTAPFSPSPSFTAIPTTAQVGDVVRLNVSESACSGAIIRGFRVAAIGTTSIVLADTLNPANGFTAADYQRFATRFDTLVHPLDVDNFGAPSDLDGNAKVAILFTKYVNELTPANSPSYVGGFFHPRDLFPRVANGGLQGCASSNEGEMFYMLVPDPTGTVNGNTRTLGFVDSLTTGILAHEYQHLINAGRRLYVNTLAEDFEETWLNEGLSHIAEELLYYRETGFQPRQRLTDALIRSDATKYAFFKSDASSNLSRLLEYIEDPGSSSPIDDSNDELSTRGAAWSFLRYAVDRRFTSDAGVWTRFSNSVNTGLTTVTDGLQTDPRPFLADFALANYIGDLGVNGDARFVHQSWNFRDIFAKTYGSRASGVFVPLGYYPIALEGLADLTATPVSVRGGSASYFRLAVPAAKEALLTFATGLDVPNPLLAFTVIRTK